MRPEMHSLVNTGYPLILSISPLQGFNFVVTSIFNNVKPVKLVHSKVVMTIIPFPTRDRELQEPWEKTLAKK